MSAPTTTHSLRERAAAYIAEARAREAQDEQDRKREETQDATARLTLALQQAASWLGEMPKPTGPTLTVDGLTFSAGRRRNGTVALRLVGTCPRCGEQTISEDVCSLYEIGVAVADGFRPHLGHVEYCRSSQATVTRPELTLIEELESVIRRIIREEVGRDE